MAGDLTKKYNAHDAKASRRKIIPEVKGFKTCLRCNSKGCNCGSNVDSKNELKSDAVFKNKFLRVK